MALDSRCFHALTVAGHFSLLKSRQPLERSGARNEIMSVAGIALNGIGLRITRRERKHERDGAAVGSVLTAVGRYDY
jgi:hypothetical protein